MRARRGHIVLDGDPLQDIGLLADPAAYTPQVIQAGAVARAALTRGPVQLQAGISEIAASSV